MPNGAEWRRTKATRGDLHDKGVVVVDFSTDVDHTVVVSDLLDVKTTGAYGWQCTVVIYCARTTFRTGDSVDLFT